MDADGLYLDGVWHERHGHVHIGCVWARIRALEAAVATGYEVELGYQRRIKGLEKALRGLVDRIKVVADSPEYKGVWLMAMIHGQAYAGPTFEAALDTARRALPRKSK